MLYHNNIYEMNKDLSENFHCICLNCHLLALSKENSYLQLRDTHPQTVCILPSFKSFILVTAVTIPLKYKIRINPYHYGMHLFNWTPSMGSNLFIIPEKFSAPGQSEKHLHHLSTPSSVSPLSLGCFSAWEYNN